MSGSNNNPVFSVVVCRERAEAPEGALACIIGEHISFNAEDLQSFFTRAWRPIIYDAMLIAAAVAFCDRANKRSTISWMRHFHLTAPVHDLDRWGEPQVRQTLIDALQKLTGDIWEIEFVKTGVAAPGPSQGMLELDREIDAVIPFSDGLDSRAVAAVLADELGPRLARVRVGQKQIDKPQAAGRPEPFTTIPFRVRMGSIRNCESSARSRGFTFAMVSGLAAYLADARAAIVPESGQGALGPVLVNSGQVYPDRRTHPEFTALMTDFFDALLGHRIAFDHPALWLTKGQSLLRYKEKFPDDDSWKRTRSCWQDARRASVNREYRQCGICAACMMRRTSLAAAGFEEDGRAYVWENLDAADFWDGAHPDFRARHGVLRKYAIAGALYMDHLANLASAPYFVATVRRQALILSKSFDVSFDEADNRIRILVDAHRREWRAFVSRLSKNSFLREWIADA